MLNKISKRTKIILIGILALIAIFTISYVGTGTYLDKKAQAQTDKVKEEEQKIAQAKKDNLNNNMKIQFYTGENIDSNTTVEKIKKENTIDKISMEELKALALNDGYKLFSKGENSIVFKRDNKNVLQDNNYYLSFEKDKLAVYKCENNKLIFVEYAENTKSRDEIKMSKGEDVVKKIENLEISSSDKIQIEDVAMGYTS